MTTDGLSPLTPPPAFLDEVRHLGVDFEPGDLEQLGRFLALLLERTRQFNLTAIRDPDEAWQRHIFDSLTLLPLLVSAAAAKVIDVGSGGGLPGVPLAITLPSVQFTLLEATGKKARFLDEAVADLKLENVRVIAERAETAAHDRAAHREQYDAAIARAVGPLNVLLELTIPFVRVGGLVFAVKGARAAEEIDDAAAALDILHAAVTDTIRTPTGSVVVVEKQRRTPRIYPRRPGEPKRAPLR